MKTFRHKTEKQINPDPVTFLLNQRLSFVLIDSSRLMFQSRLLTIEPKKSYPRTKIQYLRTLSYSWVRWTWLDKSRTIVIQLMLRIIVSSESFQKELFFWYPSVFVMFFSWIRMTWFWKSGTSQYEKDWQYHFWERFRKIIFSDEIELTLTGDVPDIVRSQFCSGQLCYSGKWRSLTIKLNIDKADFHVLFLILYHICRFLYDPVRVWTHSHNTIQDEYFTWDIS